MQTTKVKCRSGEFNPQFRETGQNAVQPEYKNIEYLMNDDQGLITARANGAAASDTPNQLDLFVSWVYFLVSKFPVFMCISIKNILKTFRKSETGQEVEDTGQNRGIFIRIIILPKRATMIRCLTLCLMLVYINCVFAQNEIVPEIDRKCLDCICQASSDCELKTKCHNSAGGGYYCGPYIISWAYWADGGKPGDKGGQNDFENCANNKKCAEEAVRGYMQRYGQDCDRSRTIDCYDFARIHKLGFGACSDDSFYDSNYYEKFESCYNE